jgi:urease accessory protein
VLPDGNGIHLIVASSAPGVFGGDRLTQTIVVESGARVRLSSQSATQVHANAAGALASLASTYRVENGGRLECEWDPVIPFPEAQLDQRIQIELAAGATLLWSDALMAGREARGERWRFSRLSHELRLLRAGALEYMERYRIAPGDVIPNQRWTADDACYFGTMLAVSAGIDREVASGIHNDIGRCPHVRASADLLEEELLLIRLASGKGASFHRARALAANRLRLTSQA